MPPHAASSRERGRPGRSGIERCRTIVWVQAVCDAAKVTAKELEPALGEDGRWLGVWSRYSRGGNSPSIDRLLRVNMVFPGTSRYYDSPLWSLLTNREFSKPELAAAIDWLPSEWRSYFVLSDEEQRFGARWAIHDRLPELHEKISQRAGRRGDVLDVTTAALIALRLAEWIENGEAYLRAAKSWALLESKAENFVVSRAHRYYCEALEPLRFRRFYPDHVDQIWMGRIKAITWIANCDTSDINLPAVLRDLNLSAI